VPWSGNVGGGLPCSLGTGNRGRPASPSACPYTLCTGSGVGCGLLPLIRRDGRGDTCRARGCAGVGHFLVVGSSCHLSSGGERYSSRHSRQSSVGRHGRWRWVVLQQTVEGRVLAAGHSIRPWWWLCRGCPSCHCCRSSWAVRLARHW